MRIKNNSSVSSISSYRAEKIFKATNTESYTEDEATKLRELRGVRGMVQRYTTRGSLIQKWTGITQRVEKIDGIIKSLQANNNQLERLIIICANCQEEYTNHFKLEKSHDNNITVIIKDRDNEEKLIINNLPDFLTTYSEDHKEEKIDPTKIDTFISKFNHGELTPKKLSENLHTELTEFVKTASNKQKQHYDDFLEIVTEYKKTDKIDELMNFLFKTDDTDGRQNEYTQGGPRMLLMNVSEDDAAKNLRELHGFNPIISNINNTPYIVPHNKNKELIGRIRGVHSETFWFEGNRPMQLMENDLRTFIHDLLSESYLPAIHIVMALEQKDWYNLIMKLNPYKSSATKHDESNKTQNQHLNENQNPADKLVSMATYLFGCEKDSEIKNRALDNLNNILQTKPQ